MHTHTWTQTYLLISLGISVHEKEEKSFEHVTSVLMIFPNSIEFVCLFRLSICFRFLGHIVIIRIVFVNFDTIRNCVYTQYIVHSILDIANFPFINISSAVQRTDLFFMAAIRSGAFTNHDEIQYDVNTSCNTAQRSVYLPLWHVLIFYCCRLLLRYTTPRFGISILCLHSVHGCVNWEWNRFSAVSEVKHGMARRGKVRQNKTRLVLYVFR